MKKQSLLLSNLKEKLKKLLEALYKKGYTGTLLPYEEGMKDIINVILEKDEDSLDEYLMDYDAGV